MAPRGRPAAAAAHSDFTHDYSSSPDPLAMSTDDSTPAPTPFRRARRTASPSKSIVMNTPRTAGASPWRIKVTVQAEPESDADNTMSPTVKKVTRTRTTTVPLRDADATSPVKRRGRPRKSDAAATPRPKRSGTPARNARSKSRDTSAGPAQDTVNTGVPLKRGRGRPRKSVLPAPEDDETLVAQPTTSPVTTSETTHAAPEQTPQENPSSRLHGRRGTPHAAPIVISSDDESDQDSDMLTPDSGDEQDHVLDAPQPFEEEEDDEDDDAQDLTNFAFEEGTTRMPDDSTIIDSEGFSMVSVDSLPSGGGLSSPPKQDETPSTSQQTIGSIMQNDYLRPSAVRELSLQHRAAPKSSPGPSRFAPAPKLVQSSPGIAAPRYVTPVVDAEIPSAPPTIQPAPAPAPAGKLETPIIRRAVTAGVALQGALDPNRHTPASSQTAPGEEHHPLNDLFRGFSEGTRKQLQDGLRLGEQLAKEEVEEQPTPIPDRPKERKSTAAPKESVFRTQRKQRSRLPTPDESDGQPSSSTPPAAEEGEVQYPTLTVTANANALPSPERSEDEGEMSREVGTSPTQAATLEAQRQEAVAINADKDSQQDDYADIWQEEASRTSESSDPVTASSPHENTRQRIRPFRRRSPNQLQDTEKSASSRQSTPSRGGSAEPQSDSLGKGKAKLSADSTAENEGEGDESIASDGSEDTGMFFQSNRPSQSRQKKVEKLDLSLLLNEGESLVPEDESLVGSSSSVVAETSAPATKSNPFLDTPPKFAALPTSPRKSSPLRREIRGSDISSDTPRRYDDSSRYEEGSSLPVPQSSPFHTQVEGDSIVSTASDQRQFRAEMEGATDSSIVHLRNEANGYLDAYEPQDRTLDEINEVTEHSKTWNQDSSIMPSSPPRIEQSFTEGSSTLARNQLHAEQSSSGLRAIHGQADTVDGSELEETEVVSSPSAQSTIPRAVAPHQPSARASPRGLVSSSSRAAPSSSQLPSHPILAKITPLPKVEPWTKTHYKTLDKLHSAHLKHPHLFSSTNIPATPLSRTNAALLKDFMSATGKPYVGAIFSAWGYSFMMTAELVVLCAVFMKNLTLNSINEYEQLSGSAIQMGDCGPGRSGDRLKATDVMNRLATVVLGERVREDEKKGRKIDRSQSLSIIWP